ncbi:MAG: hypothetical protein AAGA90_02765 [Actinomycetota bacterium]
MREPVPVDLAQMYDQALVGSKRIIDEADPEGLLAIGAPPDEYDSYSADVARRLIHGEDPSAIVGLWKPWQGRRPAAWCTEQLAILKAELAVDQ